MSRRWTMGFMHQLAALSKHSVKNKTRQDKTTIEWPLPRYSRHPPPTPTINKRHATPNNPTPKPRTMTSHSRPESRDETGRINAAIANTKLIIPRRRRRIDGFGRIEPHALHSRHALRLSDWQGCCAPFVFSQVQQKLAFTTCYDPLLIKR